MPLAPDPADRALDAAADGAFGGVSTMGDISGMSQTVGTNRRAGYGGVTFEGRAYTKLEWLLRAAKRGDCLAWGDAAKVVAYYEAEIQRLRDVVAEQNEEIFWRGP